MTEQEIQVKVKELLADMSVEEKIGQLLYLNGERPEELQYIEKYYAGTVANLSGAELSESIQERVKAASPHNIPALLMSDVISGYRTIFPLPVAEACSFDPEMIEEDTRCIGIEARTSGVSWTCAPMMDIARDPRWGRISEGAGEDPYLGEEVARARVRGLRNAGGIASCAKHYVAYGNCQGGRDYDSALANENELRNVYLRPFRAAAKEGVDSVMASFNDTLGIPMHCNKYLIDDVLRNEFGFKGAMVSDYNAIAELVNHGVAADNEEATYRAFKAGMDLDTGSLVYQKYLIEMVRDGRITEEELDKYAGRILAIKYRIGLFEKSTYTKEEEDKVTLNPEFKKQARIAAARSTVILKNEKELLPLSKKEKLLVIGELADDCDSPLGWWRCKGRTEDVTSLLSAMREKSDNITYVKGGNALDGKRISRKAIADKAKDCDKIIAVVGEPSYISGEAHTRGSVSLPGTQTELIRYAASLGKPLCIILITGRTLVVSEEASLCDAMVCPWQFGIAGEGVADILFGDVMPEGKLCASFPYNIGQLPIYYGHVTTGRPYKGEKVEMSKKVSSYATDFTCHYIDMPNDPLFPFGHGLTYTTFEIGTPKPTKDSFKLGENVTLDVDVANTGKKDARLTLQIYIHDVAAETSRPVKELKYFEKIALKAGEKKTVKVTLTPEAFEYYHFDNTLSADKGDFLIWAAEDSASGTPCKISLK